VVAELLAIMGFSPNKNCNTYLGPMLPPCGRNRQLIFPHCPRSKGQYLYFFAALPSETITLASVSTDKKIANVNKP